jgi:hypothetical protein
MMNSPPRYSWQAVVLENRNSIVTHYGRRGWLASETIDQAKREVDAIKPLSVQDGINCYQIVDEAGLVVAYRIKDAETGRAHWA